MHPNIHRNIISNNQDEEQDKDTYSHPFPL